MVNFLHGVESLPASSFISSTRNHSSVVRLCDRKRVCEKCSQHISPSTKLIFINFRHRILTFFAFVDVVVCCERVCLVISIIAASPPPTNQPKHAHNLTSWFVCLCWCERARVLVCVVRPHCNIKINNMSIRKQRHQHQHQHPHELHSHLVSVVDISFSAHAKRGQYVRLL